MRQSEIDFLINSGRSEGCYVQSETWYAFSGLDADPKGPEVPDMMLFGVHDEPVDPDTPPTLDCGPGEAVLVVRLPGKPEGEAEVIKGQGLFDTYLR